MCVHVSLPGPLRTSVSAGKVVPGGHVSLGTIGCLVLKASPGVEVGRRGCRAPACLSTCPGCPPRCLPPGSARPGRGTHGRLVLVGEGDLQRLGQLGDRDATQTQAHQAVVQHAAAVSRAELGALGRDRGRVAEARLHNPGEASWEPLGFVALALGPSLGPEGKRLWATFLLLLPIVSCLGWTREGLTVATKPRTWWRSTAGLLTGGAQGWKEDQPGERGQWVPTGR